MNRENKMNFHMKHLTIEIPRTEQTVRKGRYKNEFFKNIYAKKSNVKLQQIFTQKQLRSKSIPAKIKLAGTLNINLNMYRSEHLKKKQKEVITPIRLSKNTIGRNTLKLSLKLVSDQTPTSPHIPYRFKQENNKELQIRRSCDCFQCGSRTNFQKETLSYGVQVQQILRDTESALTKFRRTIRKQQTYLFAQYLNTPNNCNDNEINIEEVDIMGEDALIESLIQKPIISQEETFRKSKINLIQIKKQIPFFQTFLNKQKELIQVQKIKFQKQTQLVNSLHKRIYSQQIEPKISCPQLLTPRSPISSFTSIQNTLNKKHMSNPNVYLQNTSKSIFCKSNTKIPTLTEVSHQY